VSGRQKLALYTSRRLKVRIVRIINKSASFVPTNFYKFTVGKTASIYIDGEVNNWSYSASLQGVRDTLSYSGQFDDILVTINSCGGDIAEGFAIYDLLGSYGVPIKTVVIGQCCSAATIIFLAGSERLIYENVVAFMVHQAAGGIENATADQMRTVADFIDSYNERMTAIYIEKTGKTAEVVAEWMSKDSFMTAQEALDNGFATAIQKPVTAKYACTRPLPAAPTASSNQSPNTDVMKIIRNGWDRITASFNARLATPTIVAKKVTTETGEELDIAYAGDSIAEGDPVTKDGEAAPDGTYTIDGVKVVVKGGIVDSIDAGDTSKDVTASDDTKVADDKTPAVTASADTTTDTPDLDTVIAERDAAIAERDQLTARVTTLETNTTAVTAQLRTLLGSRVSPDLAVPNPKGVVKAVNTAEEVDDEEVERQNMLNERANRGKPKTAEKAE